MYNFHPCISFHFNAFICLFDVLSMMVFGLGMRVGINVHMHVKLENRVLCNGQQPQSAVKAFLTEKFMKKLSGVGLYDVTSILC